MKLPSNATSHEIVDNVRHFYPNLGPTLQQVVDALAIMPNSQEINRLREDIDHANSTIEDLQNQIIKFKNTLYKFNGNTFCCKHCGSEITPELDF